MILLRTLVLIALNRIEHSLLRNSIVLYLRFIYLDSYKGVQSAAARGDIEETRTGAVCASPQYPQVRPRVMLNYSLSFFNYSFKLFLLIINSLYLHSLIWTGQSKWG